MPPGGMQLNSNELEKMKSVAKLPNHRQCFTRDKGQKEKCSIHTRQWLIESLIDANE
jgi:hypothetical protein